MELKYITDFLKKLLDKEDVRPFLQKVFRLNLYSECSTVADALERVYGIEKMEQVMDNGGNADDSIDLSR